MVVKVLDQLAHVHVPHIDRHVIGRREDLILAMRVRLHTPHRKLVAMEYLHWAPGVTQVKCSQGLVHTTCYNHAVIVLVPIHCQDLMLVRRDALHRCIASSQVVYVQHGISSHRCQACGSGRRPYCCISNLLVGTCCHYTLCCNDVPSLNGVVPRRGGYQILVVHVPINTVNLCLMLLEGCDGAVRLGPVKQLHCPITLRCRQYMFVLLAPRAIIDTVLGSPYSHRCHACALRHVQVKDLKSPIAHNTIILSRANSQQVGVERGELAAVSWKVSANPSHARCLPGRPSSVSGRTATKCTLCAPLAKHCVEQKIHVSS
mmetsp:Transcript_66649/g.124420  ORF Transcript_66649/g.124420 Transcript_66649/m.124420 type:complete len:317 (+) Transcript_66649:320-1270(+)